MANRREFFIFFNMTRSISFTDSGPKSPCTHFDNLHGEDIAHQILPFYKPHHNISELLCSFTEYISSCFDEFS